MKNINYIAIAISVLALALGVASVTLVTGPAGEDGAIGPTGPMGSLGPTGSDGVQGETGASGSLGATGPTGPAGARGETGPAGASGIITADITGVVVDAVTGETIEGADIITEPTSVTTSTNASGMFTLADVPKGEYSVIAFADGYNSNWVSNVEVSTDSVSVNLAVSETVYRLILMRGVNTRQANVFNYPDDQVAMTLTVLEGHDSYTYGMITNGLSNIGKGTYALLQTLNNTHDTDDIISWSWTLDAPMNSAAIIEDNDTQFPRFKTDVQGKYMVSLTVETTEGHTYSDTMPVYAGDYSGVSKCAACHSGSVMPDKVTPWSETGHADKFEASFGSYSGTRDYCIRCHVLAYDETADNGGFDDVLRSLGWDPADMSAMSFIKANPAGNMTIRDITANPTLTATINIQCETCHGPGDDAHTSALSFESDVCLQCHAQYPDYIQSAHYLNSGRNNLHMAESTDCADCHTGQGFVNYFIRGEELVFPNMVTPNNPANMIEPELQSPIGCVTCHDPHTATHPDEPNEGKSLQLRTSGEVTSPQGWIVDAGESKVCVICHSNKRDVAYLEKYLDSGNSRGPHSNTQSDVFYGEGVITWGENFSDSPHLFLTPDGCIKCHMVDGDHSWSMVASDGTEKIETCMQTFCHSAGTITTFNKISRSDFDGDGTIEGVGTEIEGLLEQLREVLPKKEDGTLYTSGFNNAGLTVLELEAYWNYNVINNDGSNGIHNTQFVVQVLQETISQLGG
ncbi:carboxypeptidase regulatory-like domain-containing protein [Thermoproteota archaeon]